jgi:CcmD family protein
MDSRNFLYMFFGFSAAWLVVVAYLIYLALRENDIRRELNRLRNMIGDRDPRRL